MPEATQQQTTIAAKTDDELERGTVTFWKGRFGFARLDRGGPDVYLGAPELARAGIEHLEIGARLCFEMRRATHRRNPWAARIRIAGTPA
jgi:cold shock CspA family protein